MAKVQISGKILLINNYDKFIQLLKVVDTFQFQNQSQFQLQPMTLLDVWATSRVEIEIEIDFEIEKCQLTG